MEKGGLRLRGAVLSFEKKNLCAIRAKKGLASLGERPLHRWGERGAGKIVAEKNWGFAQYVPLSTCFLS